MRCNRNVITIIHCEINYFVYIFFPCHIYWVKSVLSFGLYILYCEVVGAVLCVSIKLFFLLKILFVEFSSFCWISFACIWPLFMLILLHFSFTMLFSFWMPGEQRFVYYLQSFFFFFIFRIQYCLLCFFCLLIRDTVILFTKTYS